MAQLIHFCLVFIVGLSGFFLFRLLRIPSPALLGAMAATGALNAAGWYPAFPVWPVSFLATALIGMMVGQRMNRGVFGRAVRLIRPVLTQAAGILVLSLLCGFILHRMAGGSPGNGISLATALIAATGGGINEMIAFGMSVDADVTVIVFAQLFRLVIVLSIIPHLAAIAEKIAGPKPLTAIGGRGDSPMIAFGRREYVFLACCLLGGAFLGEWLRIPAGSLIGAMLFCGLLSLCVNKTYSYNAKLLPAVQICLGLLMGQRIHQDILSHLGALFLPILAISLVMLAGCALLAFLMYRTTGWDLATCLLCSAPAGLSQIAVHAEEIGADSFTVSVFHTARLLGIVLLFPVLVMLIV